MRPLRLTVKGFTSFRDEQELDLSALDLFAITGPTGSGKSSLLDAITYALYGVVERVGKQVSQLISQGQARLAVTLEFAAGDDVYRLTRTTPRAGNTKILLQRRDGDEWISDGEDADRVAGVNKRVHEIVGLDYDAFTRSVLLPQGKFAEFLVGEPAKRREILTELLGLELFKRMASRANELAKEAKQKAETTAAVMEDTFAGATEETLAAAKAHADEAAGREETLRKAGEAVGEIADRWKTTKAVVSSLRSVAEDAREAVAAVRASAETIRERAASIARAAGERAAREKALKATAELATAAANALTEATKEWGDATTLIEARAKAESLAAQRAEIAAVEKDIAGLAKREPALAKALEAAGAALKAKQEAVAAADQALQDAREAYARDNALAFVCAGLHAGEPCPVCGTALAKAPKVATDLAKAKAAGDKLNKAHGVAAEAVRAAERALHGAERDVADAAKEAARLSADVERKRTAAAKAEQAIAKIFRGESPADPVATLTERIAGLESLAGKQREADAAVRAAEAAQAAVERDAAAALAALVAERARVEAQPFASLAKRAKEAAGRAFAPPKLPAVPDGEDPGALAAAADGIADGLEEMAVSLDEAASQHGAGEQAMLAEARDVVGDLLPLARSFEDLLAALAETIRKGTEEVAGARARVATITEQLAKRAELAQQVEALGARADVFRVLALELRADRLVAFLQSEALQVLSLAGTQHLQSLSDGRYRLECEADEFMVVDTWNGEEARSVKTLSGGETFMASLALALALSEQQPSLSVGRKARIDSLFLDEGFGTLDPDSLEEVVQAIEQLGGDGRMVGVITHISELAERLPAKVAVEKSPRGSRIRIAT